MQVQLAHSYKMKYTAALHGVSMELPARPLSIFATHCSYSLVVLSVPVHQAKRASLLEHLVLQLSTRGY